MEPKHPATRVVPEGALLHFAFTQRQYAAVLAATQYFARKLQDPKQRELALSALAVLATPTAFSLPSEEVVEEVLPATKEVVPAEDMSTVNIDERPPRGLDALRGGRSR